MPTKTAYFAAGCFWGIQAYFDQVPGVMKTEVGYMGGHTKNPTYEEVCSGRTGHAEAIKIEYDPAKISYQTLLKHFFRMHDPTMYWRQGPDIGSEYRSAIFFQTAEEEAEGNKEIANIDQSGEYKDPVVTEVVAAGEYYPAEAFHQKFVERTGWWSCPVPYAPVE